MKHDRVYWAFQMSMLALTYLALTKEPTVAYRIAFNLWVVLFTLTWYKVYPMVFSDRLFQRLLLFLLIMAYPVTLAFQIQNMSGAALGFLCLVLYGYHLIPANMPADLTAKGEEIKW